MNMFKLLIALALAGFAYQYWSKHHQGRVAVASAGSAESHNGFITLPPVTGASTTAVLVVAAENCPEDAAQRADRLAEQLARDGVPVARVHNVSFDIANGDSSAADQVMSVMNNDLPIVFVRGKAKSNPTLEEVAAEYKATAR
jgi:hypothetical protein